MMHMYINYTLIPKMLEVISNGTTEAKLFENYGLTKLLQDTVVERIVNLGIKYDCIVKNYFVDIYEKKDTIWYR